ncbi:MAG: hypothetical protein NTU83_08505 [Candidatus Hydrogenedentes bacterium]|nr:hypothetical protein [Candidatus Hydrogenedentota bacterium]
MIGRTKVLLVVAVVAATGISTGAYSVPFYDNFNDGNLDGWTAAGTSVANGVAVQGGVDGYLYQAVSLDPLSPGEQYQFQFDFDNTLSSEAAFNSSFDVFFASLYFTDTPGNPATPSALAGLDYLALFDQDSSGVALDTGGVCALAGGWSRYVLDFTTQHAYVIPIFEFYDLNNASDSQVRLDNVSLIPEPVTVTMLGGLAAGMWAARRLRRKTSR